MKKAFEKILDRLEGQKDIEHDDSAAEIVSTRIWNKAIQRAKGIVEGVSKEHNNGWIPCTERMPEVETEVLILAKRKFRDGGFRYIRTTAMYEDGTVSECNSCWYWYDIEGEWDEENDCYIVPEGWWENKHYNPDECYNNEVDDEVIAWQQLPEPYKESENE